VDILQAGLYLILFLILFEVILIVLLFMLWVFLAVVGVMLWTTLQIAKLLAGKRKRKQQPTNVTARDGLSLTGCDEQPNALIPDTTVQQYNGVGMPMEFTEKTLPRMLH
jgi:hypothetical protein